MNREAIDQWCERGIMALALVTLIFTPLAFGGRAQPAVGSWVDYLAVNPFVVPQGCAIGITALWMVRVAVNPSQRLLWPPICWAVVAFTVYAVVRYLTAEIEYVARQEMICVLVNAYLFLAILNNLHRQETTLIIALALVFLAMVISGYAIYQFLSSSDHVWHLLKPYPHRGSGTYISPNHLGGFLEMVLPLCLAYTLTSRVKPVLKVFLGYASLVILAAIGTTLSRGAWVSTAAALLLFFGILLFQRKYRFPAIVFFALVLGAGICLVPRSYYVQARLNQLAKDKQAGIVGRSDFWPAAIRIWKENIWWGAGPAHFDYRFRQYRPEDSQVRPDRTHNDYLNTLVDWGIVGTALVAAAWLALWAGVIKAWRFVRPTPRDLGEKKNSNKFAFLLGASVGLVAILVHSIVDFNMHIPANAIVAVSLMALLTSHLRFATDRYWTNAGPAVKAVAGVLMAAGLVYLGYDNRRHEIESVRLARAALAPSYSLAQVAELTKAFHADPHNGETALFIGEALRVQSSFGESNYRELATQAMEWYARAMKLNPLDPRGFLGYGRCLDWLDRKHESATYFSRAEELDPNGYFTLALIGVHYVELGDYAAARSWFERSRRLDDLDNDIAKNYVELSNQRLLEAATNDLASRLAMPK